MMTQYKTLSAAMAVLLAVGGIAATVVAPTAAFAEEQQNGTDDAAEFAKLGSAKLSLADAVAAAEKAEGGKAVNAVLDNEQANAMFEIELMTANGSHSVSVDAMTGQVAAVTDNGENGQESDTE